MLLSGCIPLLLVGAGAGGAIYYGDKAEENLKKNIQQVYDATIKVADKNELEVTKKKKDSFTGLVEGKFADGKKFSVQMNKVTKISSKISIRIGPIFNKDRAKFILGQIKDELGI